jgi:hypothetical protein
MSESTARAARRINRHALQEKTWARVGFKPHKGQAMIAKSPARHRVCSCGRRFGKSFIGGHELTCEALKTRILLPQLESSERRREFWIVGPNYTDAEKEFRVLYNDLSRLGAPFDKPGTYNNPHDGDMQISMFNGKFIVMAKSAQYPERLVGEGLNGVIMAEAAKQKERTWTKYIRPMLADFNGWSLHTSTPEGKNWFYDNWMRGQSATDPDWESWRMPSWRNPYVYPGGASQKGIDTLQTLMEQKVPITDEVLVRLGIDLEIGALARDLTTEAFNQEIGAQFNEFVGRVFKDFDDEVHVKDLVYQPGWETLAASDYGFTNPFVWLLLQINPVDGTVHVLEEIYEPGLTIDDAITLIIDRGLCPPSMREFYPDPASPGDTRAIEKRLRIRGMKGTGGELDTRLRMIRAALKVRHPELPEDHPERKPRLLINRKCENVIREFGAYRYPKTSAEAAEAKSNIPEKPMKKDDHTPEALGRFYAGKFNVPERKGARSSQANYR